MNTQIQGKYQNFYHLSRSLVYRCYALHTNRRCRRPLTANNGEFHLHFSQICRCDLEDIVAEHHHVGEFAGSYTSLLPLLKFSISRAQAVSRYGFGHGQLLLGVPSIGMFGVQRARVTAAISIRNTSKKRVTYATPFTAAPTATDDYIAAIP